MNRSKMIKMMAKSQLSKAFKSKQSYQTKKLQQLLKHAKKNSEFFKELYKDIDVDQITPFNLHLLPPVIK